MQRVLAFVDLVMHAVRNSWTWDGWRCGDLRGPNPDETGNSCAAALLLIGLRLSRGVGVPIKWADGVLDLARDLFATHLLASASFSPRWGGSPDGETFVVRECWTWSAHSRSVVEGALVCAVVYGGASLGLPLGLLGSATLMFADSEPLFHDAYMYLAFKRLMEQDVGKEENAEVVSAAVEAKVKRAVDAMVRFKSVHGQWASSVIQRLYDHFACA